MNINSYESTTTSQSTSTTPNVTPREEEELSPRKKISISLKSAVRNLPYMNRENLAAKEPTMKNFSAVNRENAIKQEILEYQQIKQTKNKRVDIIIDLRKVYNCLINVFSDKNNKIILTGNGHLKVIQAKNALPNFELNQAIIKFIYHKILRGMTTNIDYFFDDRGYFVTLKEMDKLAIKIFGDQQSPLQIDIENELIHYYEDKPMFLWSKAVVGESEYLDLISHLGYPKILEYQDFSENERLCISIFQRLYPSRGPKNTLEEVPLMSPITFLYSYKNYLTTPELFNQALCVLNLPELDMPYLQKLRVLNFLRVGIGSNLIQSQDFNNNVRSVINKIILMQTTKKQEFKDICNEIQFLSEKNELDSLLEKCEMPSKILYPVEKFFLADTFKPMQYAEFLNALTDDIKHLASQAFFNVTLASLFKEKGENKTEFFYHSLINYIATIFINTFDTQIEITNKDQIKDKLDHFFEVFIDVAYNLVKKHDYLSSFAIYNLLNISIFSKLIDDLMDKTNKNTFSKSKKNKKVLEISNKLTELNEIFSLNKNFETLRKKMKECQVLHVFYVPLLGPIKNVILHKLEMIESTFTDGPKINNPKLQMIAEEAWEVNEFLQDVRGHFKSQKIALQTDIGLHLNVNNEYDEERLEEIYKNLKQLLNSYNIQSENEQKKWRKTT